MSKPIIQCIASGYEWVCPSCEVLNTEVAWPKHGDTFCEECSQEVELDHPNHAYD